MSVYWELAWIPWDSHFFGPIEFPWEWDIPMGMGIAKLVS